MCFKGERVWRDPTVAGGAEGSLGKPSLKEGHVGPSPSVPQQQYAPGMCQELGEGLGAHG